MTSKPPFGGEIVRLGDVCDVVGGATPKTSEPAFWDGDIKWATPAEIGDETHVLTDTVKHLTKAGYESASLHMMPAGTVLLTTRAPIGKVALAGSEMCCNQGFKCLVCSDSVNNEWLYRYLKHRSSQLQSMGTGATFKELSKRAVSDLQVVLPPMQAQLDVAANLNAVERVIHLVDAELSKLDELVKSRFVEMFGGGSWPARLISELATDIRYGTSKKASDEGLYTYLRMNNMTDDGRLDFSDTKRITLDGSELEKCLVRKGDLLFNRTNSREKVGKTAVFEEDEPMVIAGYIIRVRLGQDIRSPYLSAYMNLPHIKESLRAMAKGAVHQANINAKQLGSIQVPVPPIALQDEFISFAARVDKLRFMPLVTVPDNRRIEGGRLL